LPTYHQKKSCSDFSRDVALATYGDDNHNNVSVRANFFNHTTVQAVLDSVGVTYTMADKDAESIPYIPIKDVSFLKRTWRMDDDLGHYVCPLEEESIEKMLMVCVESKTVCKEVQAVSVIESAIGEYFWYGRTIFNEKRDMLIDVASKANLNAYLSSSTFPTWDILAERYFELSSYTDKRGSGFGASRPQTN